MRVLLVGRTHEVIDDAAAREHLEMPDVAFVTVTTYEEVVQAFKSGAFDHVIFGAGIDLDERLKMVRAVYEATNDSTVHLKNRGTGPGGFFPFVRTIVAAFSK